MGLRLGDTAPDFSADSTMGPIRFHDWLGTSWGVLFSHPRDYTPVCTTELGYTAKIKGEFDRRGVKVIGLSVDSVEDHLGWTRDIEQTQSCTLNFPMIADPDLRIADLYGMIHPHESDRFTVRALFVIDPDKNVRLTMTYPASTGRNFDEVLRVIDSLQLTDRFRVATPVNWQQGDEVVIVPAVGNDDARRMFPQGWKELRPYLRIVAQPEV